MSGVSGDHGVSRIPEISVQEVKDIFKTPQQPHHLTTKPGLNSGMLADPDSLRVNFESLKTRNGSTSTPFPSRTKCPPSASPGDESGMFDLNVTACLFPKASQPPLTYTDSGLDSGCSTTPSSVENMCMDLASPSTELSTSLQEQRIVGHTEIKPLCHADKMFSPSPLNISVRGKPTPSRMTLLHYRLRRDSGNETMDSSSEVDHTPDPLTDKTEAQEISNRTYSQHHKFSHCLGDNLVARNVSSETNIETRQGSYPENHLNCCKASAPNTTTEICDSDSNQSDSRRNHCQQLHSCQNVKDHNPEPHKRVLFDCDKKSVRSDLDLGFSPHISSSQPGYKNTCETTPPLLQKSPQTNRDSLTSHRPPMPQKEDVWEMLTKGNLIPGEPDRLIGRKMGLQSVDVMWELHIRNISCVSTILGYMEGADLCRMCLVSSEWREICESHPKAQARRTQYMKHLRAKRIRLGAENVLKDLSPRKNSSSSRRQVTEGAEPLGRVQVTGKPPSPVKETPEMSRHQQFFQEGKKLLWGESLRKCPKCQSPSRLSPAEERATCTRKGCSYDFCTKCFNNYHAAQNCSMVSPKKSKAASAVGSKKSKKNLRRL
ncbi:uncharacterized protein LOC106160873 [Lingula anatina]|uniref:Uncharacterized protein LOC106160873 n=1 Tax=Lingula anatina TaxID=7574 RepID=A0A1S3I4A8_LINAN|nr:uncharacterized protein LOC106160873 [Lingula anatina]|eukprot:XP_013393097.1 uncharacterized protein LOC106160873 [Lingula anatina]